jgi:hypothetical protein
VLATDAVRSVRKLSLILITLCVYGLGLRAAEALPLDGLLPGLASANLRAEEAKAKRRPRKARVKKVSQNAAAAKSGADVAAPNAPTPVTPPPPPNVKLKATLAPGSAALTEGLGWRVLSEKPEPNKSENVVWSGGGPEPNFHLEPGRYYVEATYGLAKSGQDIEVSPDKPLESTIVLSAGTIRASGVAVQGGPALDDMFYVLNQADPAGWAGAEVGRSSLPQAVFHVPAGAYRLTLRHGLAKTEVPVVVTAGQEVKAEGVLNAGKLTVTATASAGGPVLDDAVFFIYAEDNTGNPREIARSELPEAEFDLPAGRYRVAALWGLARVEKLLTIKPGVAAQETLILNAGTVRLSSVLTGDTKPIEQQLIYKVYAVSSDQGASTQSVAVSAKPSPTIYLKAGKYRIESQFGWHNARQTRDVEVAAGQVTDVLFEHRASEVRFKLAITPGTPAPGRVKWTLKYAGGGTVLISQDDEPSLILQAGSYQVIAQYGTKTYTRAFEANPNEVHTIEIVAE